MNTLSDTTSLEPEQATPARIVPRTKNQIRATANADARAVKAKWKTLIAEAKSVWEKIPVEDLAQVEGNFHRLAGLVQLRYQIGREETDRQVKEFFAKHYPGA